MNHPVAVAVPGPPIVGLLPDFYGSPGAAAQFGGVLGPVGAMLWAWDRHRPLFVAESR